MDAVAAPPARLPATAPAVPRTRSAFTAVVLGWLVPGFGQLYVGRPFKALLMLVSIGGLFYGGLLLTGFTCVNPKTYELEFAAHACLGGPTAAAYYLTRGFELTDALPWFEVGRLYAAVAGLLNVVAICDALGDVIEHNRGVRIQASLRQRYLMEREAERQRALETAARQAAARQETETRSAHETGEANETPTDPADDVVTPAPASPDTPAPDPRMDDDLPSFFDEPHAGPLGDATRRDDPTRGGTA